MLETGQTHTSERNRAFCLGGIELGENLLHPMILLVLSQKSISATLFNDIGLLAPSLMFRMLSYLPLSNIIPLAQATEDKAAIYLSGLTYASIIAIAYPYLYPYYDADRLANFSDEQSHAIQRLNRLQSLDILSQLLKTLLINHNYQGRLFASTAIAGALQMSSIVLADNIDIDDYVDSAQISAYARFLLLGLATFPTLHRPQTTLGSIGHAMVQLSKRAAPIVIQHIFVFNIVSSVSAKLNKYGLVGEYHILISLADLVKGFSHGMAIERQKRIANSYLAHPTAALLAGKIVIRDTLIASSMIPMIYLTTTSYNDSDNFIFLNCMGLIEMLFTLDHTLEELNKGINFNLAPNAINLIATIMTPYAINALDEQSNYREYSINIGLGALGLFKSTVVLASWHLRMKYLNRANAYNPQQDIDEPASTWSSLRDTSYNAARNVCSFFYTPTPTQNNSPAPQTIANQAQIPV